MIAAGFVNTEPMHQTNEYDYLLLDLISMIRKCYDTMINCKLEATPNLQAVDEHTTDTKTV